MACPTCNDTGLYIDGAGRMGICDCKKQQVEDRINDGFQKRSNIPKTYWNITIESFANLKACQSGGVSALGAFQPPKPLSIIDIRTRDTTIEFIEKFVRSPLSVCKIGEAKVYWIWGCDNVAGHTTAACLMGKALALLNIRVKYYSAFDLRTKFINFKEDFDAHEDLLGKDDVLILDQLFDKHGKTDIGQEYVKQALVAFIEAAMRRNKTLIITSKSELFGLCDELAHIVSVVHPNLESLHLPGSIKSAVFKRN